MHCYLTAGASTSSNPSTTGPAVQCPGTTTTRRQQHLPPPPLITLPLPLHASTDMGNTVAPCLCRKDSGTGTAAVATRGRRRPKNFVTEVPAAVPDVELEQTRAGPGRSRARAGGVSWAGGVVGADDGYDAAVGKLDSAAAVVTVKIVLKRKDAEALVARLNAQSARERKARMDELKGELFRAGDDCGIGGASPTTSPCRDAWKPSLAPIKEN